MNITKKNQNCWFLSTREIVARLLLENSCPLDIIANSNRKRFYKLHIGRYVPNLHIICKTNMYLVKNKKKSKLKDLDRTYHILSGYLNLYITIRLVLYRLGASILFIILQCCFELTLLLHFLCEKVPNYNLSLISTRVARHWYTMYWFEVVWKYCTGRFKSTVLPLLISVWCTPGNTVSITTWLKQHFI